MTIYYSATRCIARIVILYHVMYVGRSSLVMTISIRSVPFFLRYGSMVYFLYLIFDPSHDGIALVELTLINFLAAWTSIN